MTDAIDSSKLQFPDLGKLTSEEKHKMLEVIKLYGEANIIITQWNQTVAKQGFAFAINPTLIPEGLLILQTQQPVATSVADISDSESVAVDSIDNTGA